MQHDAYFFIGVFVFIFLIWVATGGPTHPLAFSGPKLSSPQELGGGSYLSLPRAPFAVGGTEVHLPGSSNGGYAPVNPYTGSSATFSTTTQNGVVIGTPSYYRGSISLNGYVSGAGGDAQTEYVQLHVNSNSTVPVDISGWTIESEATGAAIVIPKGTGVPTSGIVNSAQDIILTPGENAMLISGRSPIGASFRENKCIGYFSQFQTFSPPLPQTCPMPSQELTSFYSVYLRDASCINYVNNLSRCQATLTPPLSVSGQCQSFLVKYLNYNGCVDAHKSDADFAGDTWRIYLGRTNAMWRSSHEQVKLLDASGKTVDVFSY